MLSTILQLANTPLNVGMNFGTCWLKNPNEDVSKTVQKFLTPSRPFENNKCPVAIKYGTEMEDEAKTSYCRIMKKTTH